MIKVPLDGSNVSAVQGQHERNVTPVKTGNPAGHRPLASQAPQELAGLSKFKGLNSGTPSARPRNVSLSRNRPVDAAAEQTTRALTDTPLSLDDVRKRLEESGNGNDSKKQIDDRTTLAQSIGSVPSRDQDRLEAFKLIASVPEPCRTPGTSDALCRLQKALGGAIPNLPDRDQQATALEELGRLSARW
jgi:hypothetical protein